MKKPLIAVLSVLAVAIAVISVFYYKKDDSSNGSNERAAASAADQVKKGTLDNSGKTPGAGAGMTGAGEYASIPEVNIDIGEKMKSNPHVATDNRGALYLDAYVLFGYNSTELSDMGKESVQGFLDEYIDVVFNGGRSEDDEIEKIRIEGHSDTDGSYEYNMKLSIERAETVLEYCLYLHPELENYMYAVGCSCDYPVTDPDGTVNNEASRRVCFVAEPAEPQQSATDGM